MTVRYYSSVALQTSLTSGLSPSTTVVNVAAATGFPATTPYTLAIDYGAPNEELVQVDNAAGLNLTVTRAIDGTSATSHNPGAVVRHVSSARDFADSRAHENASSGIHGLAMGDTIVGTDATQTLHNKTLDNATGALRDVNIFDSSPAWTTSVIGATGSGAVFSVVDNPTALKTVLEAYASGSLILYDNDSTASSTQLTVLTHDLAADRAAIFVGDDLNTRQTFALFNNGALLLTGDSGKTYALTTWKDSSGNVMAAIAADGRIIANDGISVNGGQATNFVPLAVKGRVGQTANLFLVQDPTGATNYLTVTPAGAVSTNNTLTVGTSLTVNTTANITGNLTAANYVETMPWTAFSSVGSFAGGFTAGSIAPRMRKIIEAGTEVWEFEGRISGSFPAGSASTVFTFNVGNRVSHERGFICYATTSGLYGAFTAFTGTGALQIGVPTAAGGAANVDLNGVRITNPFA